jgi:DNA-binding cell septation regulator SpoVG
MKYNIKVNTVKSRNENNKVRGFASVVFEDSFKVDNIVIVENREGNLFVSMPSYMSSDRDEYNNPIFKSFCNPITSEFHKELTEAILTAYEHREEFGKEGMNVEVGNSNGELLFTVAVTPLENDEGSRKGLARMYIDESFVVSNISVVDGEKGLFVSLPSVKTGKTYKGKADFRDVCFPVTKEFRQTLYDTVLDEYNKALEQNMAVAHNVAAGTPIYTGEVQTSPFR